MDRHVIALSSNVLDCGKTVSDSKKRFTWSFRIGSKDYTLQLTSSALSGKRVVSLNHVPIYSEQKYNVYEFSVLNFNFDFNYNIDGHSFRIFREEETVNNYALRIDNRSFQYLKKKGTDPVAKVVTGKYFMKSDDPFSQFEKVSVGKTNTDARNQFGNFGDFEEFGSHSNNNAGKIQNTAFGFDDFQPDNGNKAQNSSQIQKQNSQVPNKVSQNVDLLSGDDFVPVSNQNPQKNTLDSFDFVSQGVQKAPANNFNDLLSFDNPSVPPQKNPMSDFQSLI